MVIRVVAFAVLRDRLGFAERSLELADGATVEAAVEKVFGGPAPRGVAYARNRVYAGPDERLADGDELALLPPVSGGADLIGVQAGPIDAASVLAAVRSPACGAVLLFLGTARELPGERLVALEYEAYAPMAEHFFHEVAGELRARHGVEGVAIVHRTGPVRTGEASLAIAVASTHRAAGFAALRDAIEAIKARAPVWKKEVTERGSRWVEAEKMEEG